MRTVPIHDLKRRLAELVDDAGAGERIVITRRGSPVAILAPFEGSSSHVGARFGRARLKPLDIPTRGSILKTLADDRAPDR
jgi:prevent-host-death family protein